MSYEPFKTPFVNIYVADSKGKKFVLLPYQIRRLVDKVEIKELFGTGWCKPGQITISFLEGSREPYPTNKQINTSVSYPVDSKGSGGLTNNTGMLSDLRYTNNGGEESITSLAKTATGLILDNLPDAADLGNAVASALLEEASGESPKLITMNGTPPSNKPIKYIFQQRNQIKIVWGYLEDPDNRRSVIGYINGIDMEFPENDMPKLKVVCSDTALQFDQVSGVFGSSYFNKKTSGVTSFGDTVSDFDNLTVKEMIEKFSKDAGMADPIVSDEFDDIALDKYAFNIIPAGMSPNQFFGELSKKYDAYYRVQIDPATGEDTIVFLSKREYQAKLISNNKALLTYRNPQSLIKSVTLKAEYTNLNGHAKGGVGENGKMTTIATKTPVTVGIVDTAAQYTDSDPTGSNPVTAAKGSVAALNTPYTVGTHEYTPEMNDPNTVQRQVDSKAHCQIEDTVMVNLTTLGFPKFRPGPWWVGGLGERYTGTYKINEVTHSIDASGYICTMQGSNYSDYGSTGKNADGIAQTQKITGKADVGLYNPGNFNSSSSGSASDTYNKNQETGD